MIHSLSIEELCKRLRPILKEKIDKIYLRYKLAETRQEKVEIEQLISALYQKHISKDFLTDIVLLEPPEKDVIKGEYALGMVTYSKKELYPFGLREMDWVRHMCVSGMSGSGKTTFAFQIIGTFLLKKKPFIVFDWKKSFRPLMHLDKDIMCFTVGNQKVSNVFRININEPPEGVDPKEWVGILGDLITECFFASYGTHKFLVETLDEAFKDFGVYEGSGNFPTWLQIKDRLQEKADSMGMRKGRESEWLTSAMRIAQALTFGHFGGAVNYKGKHAMSVKELMDKKVIFELNSLSSIEKKFFCEYLLIYIYRMVKAAEATAESKFKSAIIVDEAHNAFLKKRTTFLQESVTEVIFRELREYGISLICLDQHISKLSDVVAGNAACNIAFQQFLHDDVETVSGIMQMRDRKKYFTMLPVGTAIVKLADRYFEPFLLKVPNVEIRQKTVSDAYVHKRMKSVVKNAKRLKIFRENFDEEKLKKRMAKMEEIYTKSGMKKKKAKGRVIEPIPKSQQRMKKKPKKFRLDKDAVSFLKLVKKKPDVASTKLYKELGFSSRKGTTIKDNLYEEGLVKIVENRDESGWKKVIELTEDGKKALSKAKNS